MMRVAVALHSGIKRGRESGARRGEAIRQQARAIASALLSKKEISSRTLQERDTGHTTTRPGLT